MASPRKSSKVQNLDNYNDWKIILKNESAQQLVLYNEADRSLQVHESSDCRVKVKVCGECGRPYDTQYHNKSDIREHPDNNNSAFMDRNYFRLLDISSKQQSPLLQYEELETGSEKRKSNTSKNQNRKKSASFSASSSSEEFESFHPKNLSDSSINQGYYRRFFKEDNKLGRGSGGSVFKCQHVLDGIELGAYAVKKVPVGDNHSWLNRMLREVHILENLRHPNIIEYKHAWLEYHQLTPFGPAIPCLFILMQLAEGGNLEEFILNSRREDPPLPVSVYCEWFEQICQGLAHLHRCGILHRDLKPSNILLKSGQDGKISLLITDFGECTSTSGDDLSIQNRTGATGTIEFVAPELLKVDRKSGKFLYQQSKSTDIWSLGLIFYFMLTGKLPYADIEDIETLKNVMCSLNQVILPKESNKLPKGFRKALASMLQVDPDLRPTIEQVLILIRDETLEKQSNNSHINVPNPISVPPKLQRRLSLPPPPPQSISIQNTPLDENTRITLALLIICISVIPTYPTIPSFRRLVLALGFTFSVLKSSKQRTAIVLLITYSILILAFYINKID